MIGAGRRIDARGRAVVVTGASSGLGREAALHLNRTGFRVFAGVRDRAAADDLAAATAGRITPLRLDVTRADEVRQAVDEVTRQVGTDGLWGLVNNAGISLPGPLECVTLEQVRRQLDTNVVGQIAVIQGFLPLLRAGHGRIVNVTSGLGRVALPYLGVYAAAQFAKEAVSDSLRRELWPFGIAVSVVQPGAIQTPIWDKVAHAGSETMAGAAGRAGDLYDEPFSRFLTRLAAQARRSGTTPADFARAVTRALTAARPKTRYPVGRDVRLGSLAARLLPDALLDRNFAPLVRARRKPSSVPVDPTPVPLAPTNSED
ncbi:short-chain dehydrogenase [Micromonospora sp. ATCC 39149]|uniref:SDR family oxidoreductase n=1 Tax=Micromonospora carbonacea TaxID=47853 RepID=A0A7D5Y6F6_9ACTN|nr:SDR family oxidoreductase [Micromonospora sp. ATCC 39149]EEP73200.1 short-chain dehydrogenase [Micromonospora sp. ATCC 39149]QLJ99232.1 SDR family oxidoreductase [Micromonospora carbonacea]